MTRRKTPPPTEPVPTTVCPVCKKTVRVRADGNLTRHKFGKNSGPCAGALQSSNDAGLK